MPRGSPDWKETAPQKSLEQLLREGNGMGSWGGGGAVAGKYRYAQLWNPATSNVDALVVLASLHAGVASTAYMSWSTTALSMLNFRGFNRKLGGVGSVLETRTEDIAVIGPPYLAELELTGGVYDSYSPLYIWIPQGYGLVFFPDTVNISLRVNYIWFEFTEY